MLEAELNMLKAIDNNTKSSSNRKNASSFEDGCKDRISIIESEVTFISSSVLQDARKLLSAEPKLLDVSALLNISPRELLLR